MLACAFMQLNEKCIKESRDTDSYRAIAGSSIILKCFEACILVYMGRQTKLRLCSLVLQKNVVVQIQEVLQHFLKRS